MKGFQLKKQLTLPKMCVTSLLCGPRVDLWPFYGFLCKRFFLYIKSNAVAIYKSNAYNRQSTDKLLFTTDRVVRTADRVNVATDRLVPTTERVVRTADRVPTT